MKVARIGMSVGLILAGTAALALPTFFKEFETTYKIKKDSALDKARCAVCHTSKTSIKLNPYGQDIKKAMAELKTGKKITAEVLKKVESLDSDGDGMKNGDEVGS